MKSLLYILLVLVIHEPVLKLNAQEPVLSYRLTPGEDYLLDIEIQQNTRSESLESEEISLYSRNKIVFTVDSTGADQMIYLSGQYRELLISMLAPRMNMDINSGSGKNRMLSDMVDSLETGRFHLVIASNGELVALNGIGSLFSSLSEYPTGDTTEQQVILRTLSEVYGPDAFRSLFSLFVSVYPVMQPMTSWTHDITYYFNTKPVKMVNRYYFTKSTDEHLIIQGMGMLNTLQEFEETTTMGAVRSTVSGNQTYDFYMDGETGWLQRCVSRQRLLIETTVVHSSYLPAGLKIPSYTETLFEVKGRRLLQD